VSAALQQTQKQVDALVARYGSVSMGEQEAVHAGA